MLTRAASKELVLAGLCAVVLASAQPPQYTIAFASLGPVRTSLYVADGDGSNARPLLAEPAMDYNASISRDGAWVIFTSDRAGSADIFRVHPDGSGLQRLTADRAFDDQGVLSPDGRWLAFVSTREGRANIWLLELASGRLRNLTSGSSGDFRPAWSPDGEWIAFSSDREMTAADTPKVNVGTLHRTQVYVMRRDGSDVRRLSASTGAAGSPAWSPDGTRIVYSQAALSEFPKLAPPEIAAVLSPGAGRPVMQLVSVELKSGETQMLQDGPGEKWSPRWVAPDRVAYVSAGADAGIKWTSGLPGTSGEFGNPSWSEDGKTLVFQRQDKTWPPFYEGWPSLDPSVKLIRTGVFPSYSPDGKRMVMNSASAAILHNAILMMNSDGTARRVLFEDPAKSALAPVWSPAGDRIAFAIGEFFSMAPGRNKVMSNLAILNADGTGLRILTAAGDRAAFPSWSPDGKRLVYRASDGAGRGLRIIDVDSEQITVLTDDSYHDNFPSWSPAGDQIAFTTDRDGDYEIYSIAPDGRNLRRLTRSPGNDAHLTWSPDGKWIAFASARTGFLDEVLLHPGNPQPTGEIFVMSADGTVVRQVTENQYEDGTPVWKPLSAAK